MFYCRLGQKFYNKNLFAGTGRFILTATSVQNLIHSHRQAATVSICCRKMSLHILLGKDSYPAKWRLHDIQIKNEGAVFQCWKYIFPIKRETQLFSFITKVTEERYERHVKLQA